MSHSSQLVIAAPTPTRDHSTPSSRPGSPHGQRQLIARRGSVSAPDPLGTRTTPPPRSTLSRLTVIRVPQIKEVVDAVPSSGRKHYRQSPARTSSPRPGSPSRLSFSSASFSVPNSPTITPHGISPMPTSPSRMSFASASFTAPGRPQSPSGQRARTSSITSNGSASGSFQRLSPTQIYDLAKISSRPTASALPACYASPTSFTQLADDVYLPFVDRPSEVRALIASGANSRMMLLFAQALVPALASSSENKSTVPHAATGLAVTPESWNFEDLTTWMTQVSREEADDAAWVRALRVFMLPKSEVLWERVKSMLGIPPELDVEEPGPSSSSSHSNLSKGRPTSPKEPALNIDPIHPAPSAYSPSLQLDDISETAEDADAASHAVEHVMGLRVSTSLAFPSSASRAVAPAPHVRARTISSGKGAVPIRSSPLVPKSASPSPRSGSTGLSDAHLRVPSRKTACPMFPSSFDKLGMQPTLLSVM